MEAPLPQSVIEAIEVMSYSAIHIDCQYKNVIAHAIQRLIVLLPFKVQMPDLLDKDESVKSLPFTGNKEVDDCVVTFFVINKLADILSAAPRRFDELLSAMKLVIFHDHENVRTHMTDKQVVCEGLCGALLAAIDMAQVNVQKQSSTVEAEALKIQNIVRQYRGLCKKYQNMPLEVIIQEFPYDQVIFAAIGIIAITMPHMALLAPAAPLLSTKESRNFLMALPTQIGDLTYKAIMARSVHQ